MTVNTVHVRASRNAIEEAINAIPQGGLRGQQINAVLLRAGVALLGRIRRAFITKARGGVDEAGDSWKPLDPKTVAYSRRGRSKKEKKQQKRPSQALTNAQYDSWWYHYRQGLAIFRGNKASAAKRAWAIMKRKGAVTLFDKYAGRKVETLRDTGVLLNSLSPGGPGNVLRADAGAVTVGTNVPYAKWHHRGVPGKLPQRRLWPEVSKWPASWWHDITTQIKQGLADIAVQAIRGAS